MSSAKSGSVKRGERHVPEAGDMVTWWAAFLTYWGYGVLIAFGYIREFFGHLFFPKRYNPSPKGMAPFVRGFEDFYSRRLYSRVRDCFDRPVCSAAGRKVTIMERVSKDNNRTLTLTGTKKECLNLGSYNYLGFGDPDSPCKPHVFAALEKFGVASCSARMELGTMSIHRKLERLVARFVGKPAAMVFGMGFATNSSGLAALMGRGTLIISDSMNHSSIVTGARASGAKIKVFKHNTPRDLERVVRKSIIEGQPRTHRPWRKILIIVEGIYSMEGEMCALKEIVEIKKKYKCYLYVDEAHSIGALGKSGRGICEHTGVSPDDVDILMGTFTKSFGAVGGYLAADEGLIRFLRRASAGSMYSASISPPACQQVISAMKIILGEDGTDLGQRKLRALRKNANYFRKALMDEDLHVLGEWDSPVVPLMMYTPGKIPAFSRLMLERNIATVIVGFPATPLLLGRVRFCISAAHTQQDLDEAVEAISECSDLCMLRYNRSPFG